VEHDLPPWYTVYQHSQPWMARFRRLAPHFEHLAETLIGLHYIAFTILMLKRCVKQVFPANALSA